MSFGSVKNKMDIKGEPHGPQAYYGFYRFIGSHYKLRPRASSPWSISLYTRSASEPSEHQKREPSEAEPQNFISKRNCAGKAL